jgi:hypothetical protein
MSQNNPILKQKHKTYSEQAKQALYCILITVQTFD